MPSERQRDNLQKQIRRAQARISAAERRRRTRRLILMGSPTWSTSPAIPTSEIASSRDSMYS